MRREVREHAPHHDRRARVATRPGSRPPGRQSMQVTSAGTPSTTWKHPETLSSTGSGSSGSPGRRRAPKKSSCIARAPGSSTKTGHVLGAAGVEHLGDVLVLHHRQHLALPREALVLTLAPTPPRLGMAIVTSTVAASVRALPGRGAVAPHRAPVLRLSYR